MLATRPAEPWVLGAVTLIEAPDNDLCPHVHTLDSRGEGKRKLKRPGHCCRKRGTRPEPRSTEAVRER